LKIFHLKKSDFGYPSTLQRYFGDRGLGIIEVLGNLEILKEKKLALFCSVKCPGSLILKTYDLAQRLKEEGITVISGFHSPIEKECLRILLRGTQPIIICPARSLKGTRIRGEYKKPIEEERLLLLSPFKENQKRNTSETAFERNRFVAAMADAIFIAYASPNSKTEKFCKDVLKWGKPIYTLESDANKTLITLGARPITPPNMFKCLK
jgi:predicted Rossmann fold nucleotide-binding protein DprA/Smf involved in DNA uptake